MLSRVVNAFDGFVMTLTQSWDFYVTLNMMKADNCTMLRDWFPEAGADDMEGKLVEMAINWLNDGDNPYGGAKIWRYLNPAK